MNDELRVYKNIIKTCDSLNSAIYNSKNVDYKELSDEERTILRHPNFMIAESIIKDFCLDDARKIAKIVLAYTGE